MPKRIKIGIMSKEDYRKRTIAIAKGEYKPKKGEPKIWFESFNSMAQILSDDNQTLLQMIIEEHPKSLKELETLSGRKSSNLSRTLKTLERFGIVELNKEKKNLIPKVKASSFQVDVDLTKHAV
jgi:predicted transcriptional regulator